MLRDFFDAKRSEHVRFSADCNADPTSILRTSCQMQLEGGIVKNERMRPTYCVASQRNLVESRLDLENFPES